MVRNPTIATAMIAFSIANVYVVLTYVKKLEEEKCKCSEGIARDVMKLITLVRLFIYIFAGLLMFYALARMATLVQGHQPSLPAPAKRQGKSKGKGRNKK